MAREPQKKQSGYSYDEVFGPNPKDYVTYPQQNGFSYDDVFGAQTAPDNTPAVGRGVPVTQKDDLLSVPTNLARGLASFFTSGAKAVEQAVTDTSAFDPPPVWKGFNSQEMATWETRQRQRQISKLSDYDEFNRQVLPAPEGGSVLDNVAYGLGRVAPSFAAGPIGGGLTAGAIQGADTGAQLRERGVAPETAGRSAVLDAGISAAGNMIAPGSGGLIKRVVQGAAVNTGVGGAADLAVSRQLSAEGYSAEAALRDPLNPSARGTDAAIGALASAFLGGRGGVRPQPEAAVPEVQPALPAPNERLALPAPSVPPASPTRTSRQEVAPLYQHTRTDKNGNEVTTFYKPAGKNEKGEDLYQPVNERGQPTKAKPRTAPKGNFVEVRRTPTTLVPGGKPIPLNDSSGYVRPENAYQRTIDQGSQAPVESPSDRRRPPPSGYDLPIDQSFDPRTPPPATYGDTQPQRPRYAQFEADEPPRRFGQRVDNPEPSPSDPPPNVRASAFETDEPSWAIQIRELERQVSAMEAKPQTPERQDRISRAREAIAAFRAALTDDVEAPQMRYIPADEAPRSLPPEPGPRAEAPQPDSYRAQRRPFALNRPSEMTGPPAASGAQARGARVSAAIPPEPDFDPRNTPLGRRPDSALRHEDPNIADVENRLTQDDMAPADKRLPAEDRARLEAALDDMYRDAASDRDNLSSVPLRDAKDVPPGQALDRANVDPRFSDEEGATRWREQQIVDLGNILRKDDAVRARGGKPLDPSNRRAVENTYRRYAGKEWVPNNDLRGRTEPPIDTPAPRQNVKSNVDPKRFIEQKVTQAESLRDAIKKMREDGADKAALQAKEKQLKNLVDSIEKDLRLQGGSGDTPFDPRIIYSGVPWPDKSFPEILRYVLSGDIRNRAQKISEFARRSAEVGLTDTQTLSVLRRSRLGKAYADWSDDQVMNLVRRERAKADVDDDGRGGPKPELGTYDRELLARFEALREQDVQKQKAKAAPKETIERVGKDHERTITPDNRAQDAEADRIEAEGSTQARLQKIRAQIQELEMGGRLNLSDSRKLARLQRELDALEGDRIPTGEPTTADIAKQVAKERAYANEVRKAKREGRPAPEPPTPPPAPKPVKEQPAAKTEPSPALPTKRELFDTWAKRNPEKARALVDLQSEAARTPGEQRRLDDLRKERQNWADNALARAREGKLNAFPGGLLDEVVRLVRNALDDRKGAVPPTTRRRALMSSARKIMQNQLKNDPMRARFFRDLEEGAKTMTPTRAAHAVVNMAWTATQASVGALNSLGRRWDSLRAKVDADWAKQLGIEEGQNPIDAFARKVGTDPGSGKLQEQGYTEHAKQLTGIWTNKIGKLVNDWDIVKSKRVVALAVDGKLWSRMPVSERAKAPPGVDAQDWADARELRAWFDQVWNEVTEAGVKLGKREDYFSRKLDDDLIRNNQDKFIEQATKAYQDEGLSLTEAMEAAEEFFYAAAFPKTRSLMNPVLSFDTAVSPIKRRVLGATADKHLADFYVRDAAALTARYAENMGQLVAYTQRFGQKGERLEALARFLAQNVPSGEARMIMHQLHAATGQLTGSPLPAEIRAPLTLIDTLSMMRLLGRTAILQMFEPFNIGVRARKNPISSALMVVDQLRFFSNLPVLRKPDAHTYKALAEMIGVTGSYARDMLVSSRLDGLDNALLRRMTTLYMDALGVTSLTEGQRAYALQIGDGLFKHAATDVQVKGQSAAASLDLLREYGFTEADIPQLKKLYDLMKGASSDSRVALISNPRSLAETLGSAELIKLAQGKDAKPDAVSAAEWKKVEAVRRRIAVATKLRSALYDFSMRTIQEPNPAQIPYLAKNPVGRQAYALAGFPYAYTREIRNYAAKTAYRAVTEKNLSASDRAKMLAPMSTYAPIAFAYAAAAMAVGERAMPMAMSLITGEEVDRREQDPARWFLATLSRMSAFGTPAFDTPLNMFVFNTRYERDPSTMSIGAFRAQTVSNAADIVRALPFNERNSPNTNTAEWKQQKAIYNLGIAPAIAVGGSIGAVGPLKPMAMVGLPLATSGSASSAYADATVGPRQTGRRRKFNPDNPSEYEPREYEFTPP